MKKTRAKQVLEAAGKLPAAKARALVQAVVAKAGTDDLESLLAEAAGQMEVAMANAAMAALERSLA